MAHSKRSAGARNRKEPGPTVKFVEEYGMALSRKRLEKTGFHADVTDMSTRETIETWRHMARRRLHEPNNADTRATRAFLLLREELELGPLDSFSEFEHLITTPVVGPLILTHIFADGHTTALNLALSSKRMWVILAASVNYWDFHAGRLQNMGPSGIFISATPEFTLGEMMATRLMDPYGLKPGTPFTNWHNDAIIREGDVIDSLYMVRKRAGFQEKERRQGPRAAPVHVPKFLREIFREETLATVRSIKGVKNIWKVNQFTSLPNYNVFEPQLIYAATHLQLLLIEICTQKKHIQTLHFHETPMLDRRVLAVILRACPNVTMLGLYNCPLIHFGDLIPILDLIHEINRERRVTKSGLLIRAFDFYPKFHQGLVYSNSENCPTYGLTAASMDLDVLQRGMYAILLKGFLKARRMKLKLLFSSGKALRAWLFKLPNPPLSIPTFLDGLYRYLDKTSSEKQRRQALYDLLKPVRLGLERNLDNDFPRFYRDEMGSYLPFCSSCGYEMLCEFFSAGSRIVRPDRRICAGCTLQNLLDHEPYDMHPAKIEALGQLFPDWDGKVFNQDAPLGQDGKKHSNSPEHSLMNLVSTETIRNSPPLVAVDAYGELTATRHVRQLIRDNKYHDDSLQGLPSLEELAIDPTVGEKRWPEVFNMCSEADMVARARSCILKESIKKNAGQTERKVPLDRYGQVWIRKRSNEVQSYDYRAAAQMQVGLDTKQW